MSAVEQFSSCDDPINIELKQAKNIISDLEIVACENARNVAFDGSSFKLCTPKGEIESAIDHDVLDFSVGLNLGFLKNYVSACKPDNFKLQVYAPKRPVIFKDENGILFMSPVVI
jgi:hypothetical protein